MEAVQVAIGPPVPAAPLILGVMFEGIDASTPGLPESPAGEALREREGGSHAFDGCYQDSLRHEGRFQLEGTATCCDFGNYTQCSAKLPRVEDIRTRIKHIV